VKGYRWFGVLRDKGSGIRVKGYGLRDMGSGIRYKGRILSPEPLYLKKGDR
jgi:hypothetical protein